MTETTVAPNPGVQSFLAAVKTAANKTEEKDQYVILLNAKGEYLCGPGMYDTSADLNRANVYAAEDLDWFEQQSRDFTIQDLEDAQAHQAVSEREAK